MSCYYHTDFNCPTRCRSFGNLLLTGDDYGNEVETTFGEEWWNLVTCPSEEGDTHYDEYDAHIDTVVIAVDGACRGNGRPDAECGIGIFFHHNNWDWNRAETLSKDFRTNQQAELAAGLEALRSAMRIRRHNKDIVGYHEYRRRGPTWRLRRVVIKADSAYLVNAMTDWIFKWKDNGYINSRGLPVTNAGLFRQLEDEVQALNAMDVEGQFWRRLRGENADADRLANAALDGETARDVIERDRVARNQNIYFDDSDDSDY